MADGEIHLWRAFLDCGPTALERLAKTLSHDERERASKFGYRRDRDRFVSARGILRDILGRYLRTSSRAVQFVYEPEGKPRIHAPEVDRTIQFSLSHSHGLAVYALSGTREVGVDIEAMRPDLAGDEIADWLCSPDELAELRTLTERDRREALFVCWTRKEAYLKACGSGLNIPLNSFTVSVAPDRLNQLVTDDGRAWMVRSFHPDDGYVGTAVTEGNNWKSQWWDWTDSIE